MHQEASATAELVPVIQHLKLFSQPFILAPLVLIIYWVNLLRKINHMLRTISAKHSLIKCTAETKHDNYINSRTFSTVSEIFLTIFCRLYH